MPPSFSMDTGVPRRSDPGDRLSTGIGFLDAQLGGGLAPGRLVCVRTDPGSQGELLLRELATATDARYLSTTRSEAAVAAWLSADASAVDVEYVGVDGGTPRDADAVRDRLDRAVGAAGPYSDRPSPRGGPAWPAGIEATAVALRSLDGSVVIDPVNPLERARESAYLHLLRRLRRRLRSTGGLAFLHAVAAEATPDGRWLSLQMADEVWDVSVAVRHARVEFLLTVTKSRSDDVPDRQLKLELGGDVRVDTSRDIA